MSHLLMDHPEQYNEWVYPTPSTWFIRHHYCNRFSKRNERRCFDVLMFEVQPNLPFVEDEILEGEV